MGKFSVPLNVNGDDCVVEVEPQSTLLAVLREALGLYGVKLGCEDGECGACAVLVDGSAVCSCLVLAASVEGKRITTIEGLANGEELHPIQRTFVDNHGLQCGYCTPGAIIAAKALLDENPEPSESEVRDALSGNICRCGGHSRIEAAALDALEQYRP